MEKNNKQFAKVNKEALKRLFNERLSELTEMIINEVNPDMRNMYIVQARENKNWLLQLENVNKGRKKKDFTGI